MTWLDIPAVQLTLPCRGCKRLFPITRLRAVCWEEGYELFCPDCHGDLTAVWQWMEVPEDEG